MLWLHTNGQRNPQSDFSKFLSCGYMSVWVMVRDWSTEKQGIPKQRTSASCGHLRTVVQTLQITEIRGLETLPNLVSEYFCT